MIKADSLPYVEAQLNYLGPMTETEEIAK